MTQEEAITREVHVGEIPPEWHLPRDLRQARFGERLKILRGPGSRQVFFGPQIEDLRTERSGDSAPGLPGRCLDDDRIVQGPQPAAVLAGLQGAVVDHRVGQPDRAGHPGLGFAEVRDHRRQARPVAPLGRNIARAVLRRLVAGHVPVHATAVG